MANAEKHNQENLAILSKLLQTAVQFCLQHSIPIQTFLEEAKALMVELAQREMEKSGAKVSDSRLAAATGIHRRDISRLNQGKSKKPVQNSLLTKVAGIWREHKKFKDPSGEPRPLQCEGRDSEFADMVGLVSTDLNPYSVLLELERLGSVKREGGFAELTGFSFSPSADRKRGYELLASDIESLFTAVGENVDSTTDTKNLHISTEYDNISLDDLPKIKAWILNEGSKFHKHLQRRIAKYDLDINPHARYAKKGGGRLKITTFSLSTGIEDLPATESNPKKRS
jgi:hypothetical protein